MHFFVILILIAPLSARASIFGEENVALLKLVSGQLLELERLANALEIAKENQALLLEVNKGIDRVTTQIDAVDTIIQRSQGLDPTSIKRISDITNMIYDLKSMKASVEEIVIVKLLLSEKAIGQSALQSETAYKMGQEMVGTGAVLASEAKSASPGRAAQITASAHSSSMVSQGVMLQTMAQMTQLQAMNLELQKSQLQREVYTERSRRSFLASELMKSKKGVIR